MIRYAVHSNAPVSATKDALKRRAADLFDPRLARAVSMNIEKDARGAAKDWRLASKNGAARGPRLPADRFYAQLGVGEFSGRLTVAWNGMDNFVFIPDDVNPFHYVTSDGRVIQPRLMDTDGGSTPKILRGLKKFSSWGFAPAFVLHDWLFTAKKCRFEPDRDWTFAGTAMIMAEAMKTLMERPYLGFDDAPIHIERAVEVLYVMFQAVSSSVALKLWNDDTTVYCRT